MATTSAEVSASVIALGLPAGSRPYRNGYYATATGDVYSTRRGRVLRMKARPNKGYLIVVTVEADGSRRTTGVHRIICEAFHGPAPAGQDTCRHLDGSRTRNVPSNLAWGTQADNVQDCIRHGRYRGPEIARAHNPKRRGSAHHRAAISDVDVRTIRARHELGEKIVSIARDYTLSAEQVSKVARRIAWSWVS